MLQLLVETLEQQKRCELLTQQEVDLRGQVRWLSGQLLSIACALLLFAAGSVFREV